MAVKRKVDLVPNSDGETFTVVRLVNTLRWAIGERVGRREVEDMIRSPGFEVTVKPAK